MGNLFKESKAEEKLSEVDLPIFNTDESKFLKKGKIRGIIIYEDGSYSEHFFKLKQGYVVNIRKRYYQVIPRCIIRGKRPTISWYFNNPCPLEFKYENSKLKASKFYTEKEIQALTAEDKSIVMNTTIDADALKAMADSNVLQGMYARTSVTPRTFILILIVLVVVAIVILQLTGQIDIMGMLQGGANK